MNYYFYQRKYLLLHLIIRQNCMINQQHNYDLLCNFAVTLFVRVWIEIDYVSDDGVLRVSHPLREGVD